MAELKLITDYLEGLEEGYYEWDYRGMNASYVVKEQQLKFFGYLRIQSPKCKQCIEESMAVKNRGAEI